MALTDDELFDFDKAPLWGWESDHVARVFAEEREVYRAQLVAARWIDWWRGRIAEPDSPAQSQNSKDYLRGYDDALSEVIARLRQGDFVPSGSLHDDTDTRRL